MLNRIAAHMNEENYTKKQISSRSRNQLCCLKKSFIANGFNWNIDAILSIDSRDHLVSHSRQEIITSTSTSKAQNLKTTDPKNSSSTKFNRHNSEKTAKQFACFFNQRAQHKSNKMLNYIYHISAISLTLFAILLSQTHFVSADAQLQSQLHKLKVTPDIVPISSSVETIKVEVNGNIVKPGDPVPAKHFKDLNMDKITWDVSNYDARHTLVLLDLDRKPMASSGNNTNTIYNQFTSLNIPGNVIKAGQNIAAFDTPTIPCQPSLKHRILMLAFHQKQNIDISDVAYLSSASGYSPKRENFRIPEFMNKHRLELVAANIILASGESNGVCSSASSNYNNVSSILFAMVITATAFGYKSRRLVAN